ncbi:hypothetical protein ACFP3I_09830 [Chryseobacterium arachidis]
MIIFFNFQINKFPNFQIIKNYGRSNYNASSFRYNDGRKGGKMA